VASFSLHSLVSWCRASVGREFVSILGVGPVMLNTQKDIIDRKIDSQVTRTKARPLPSGDISVVGAVIFCIFQSAMTVALFHAILPNTV
jgi:4-hydroxybenzoate polyprenyltransferase